MTVTRKIAGKIADLTLRPSVKTVIAAHGVALVIALMVCWFGIRVLHPCEGVDAYPSSMTLFVFDVARWMKIYTTITFCFAGAVVLWDALLYVLLGKFAGKRGAAAWFWCILALLIYGVYFTVWTMHRPTFFPLLNIRLKDIAGTVPILLPSRVN